MTNHFIVSIDACLAPKVFNNLSLNRFKSDLNRFMIKHNPSHSEYLCIANIFRFNNTGRK